MRHLRRGTTALAVAGLLALAGCTGSTESSEPSSTPSAASDAPTAEAVEPDLALAESSPVEDSVYPGVGHPDVDALLYDLDLAWAPDQRTLTGTATLTFRAARDTPTFRLDLARPLEVASVTLDGDEAAYRHRGKDLVVRSPISEGDRHELVVEYAGKPRPVPAPTTRGDFSTVGFTVTDRAEVWTMQEPYGAYSWYPVNDQPSDKALYDISVSVPSPWTGIANGRLVSTESSDGPSGEDLTTTRWQLDEPAASYLVTLAIGDYTHRSNTATSGLTVDYWIPRGLPGAYDDLKVAAKAVDWIEQRLGPYPFTSLGLVLTDSQSAMETQTMITMGNTEYVRSAPVVVHEIVHQWYGDQVSPADWSDVWLNEGMTMLMQALYEADRGGYDVGVQIAEWRGVDQQLRDEYGPPGAYDRRQFGGSNIYYSPAVMWDELRRELGDEEFFEVARSWLTDQDNRSVTRQQVYDHWEAETGLELTRFFDAWITGRTTPPEGLIGA
ncbi:M1 family metallopeptidase [Nocardioides terrigena]|uniref:M1 family metallopeptidase n=1 Tax=Nocardioides terrigena TaxID=424797 RepID=UPI000D2FC057|nr:M1 family metallopeptidase [Nocardioides terrigena]